MIAWSHRCRKTLGEYRTDNGRCCTAVSQSVAGAQAGGDRRSSLPVRTNRSIDRLPPRRPASARDGVSTGAIRCEESVDQSPTGTPGAGCDPVGSGAGTGDSPRRRQRRVRDEGGLRGGPARLDLPWAAARSQDLADRGRCTGDRPGSEAWSSSGQSGRRDLLPCRPGGRAVAARRSRAALASRGATAADAVTECGRRRAGGGVVPYRRGRGACGPRPRPAGTPRRLRTGAGAVLQFCPTGSTAPSAKRTRLVPAAPIAAGGRGQVEGTARERRRRGVRGSVGRSVVLQKCPSRDS